MIARVIVQENDMGEKHVTFTQDMNSPVKDFLIDNDTWKNSKVTEGRALILSMDEFTADNLLDEFHTAWTSHPPINMGKTRIDIGEYYEAV
jgi:hypothetical protein